MKVFNGGDYLNNQIAQLESKKQTIQQKLRLLRSESDQLHTNINNLQSGLVQIEDLPDQRGSLILSLLKEDVIGHRRFLNLLALGNISLSALALLVIKVVAYLQDDTFNILMTAFVVPVFILIQLLEPILGTGLTLKGSSLGRAITIWTLLFGLPFVSLLYLYLRNSKLKRERSKEKESLDNVKVQQIHEQGKQKQKLKQVKSQISEATRVENDLLKKLENLRRGRDGEDAMVATLSEFLNDNWTLYQNLSLKIQDGSLADIDAVLVGPTGVYVIEVKNYTTDHRCIGFVWERKINSGDWVKWEKGNPAIQLNNNAKRVQGYFQECNVHIQVKSRIGWAGTGDFTIQNQPPFLVWDPSNPSFIHKDIMWNSEENAQALKNAHNALKARI